MLDANLKQQLQGLLTNLREPIELISSLGDDAKSAELLAWGKANGIAELALPRDVRVVEALPVLGTGKLDYVTMGAMAAG